MIHPLPSILIPIIIIIIIINRTSRAFGSLHLILARLHHPVIGEAATSGHCITNGRLTSRIGYRRSACAYVPGVGKGKNMEGLWKRKQARHQSIIIPNLHVVSAWHVKHFLTGHIIPLSDSKEASVRNHRPPQIHSLVDQAHDSSLVNHIPRCSVGWRPKASRRDMSS
jgi:hypothetical protein